MEAEDQVAEVAVARAPEEVVGRGGAVAVEEAVEGQHAGEVPHPLGHLQGAGGHQVEGAPVRRQREAELLVGRPPVLLQARPHRLHRPQRHGPLAQRISRPHQVHKLLVLQHEEPSLPVPHVLAHLRQPS